MIGDEEWIKEQIEKRGLLDRRWDDNEYWDTQTVCEDCHGTGQVQMVLGPEMCNECYGIGVVTE